MGGLKRKVQDLRIDVSNLHDHLYTTSRLEKNDKIKKILQIFHQKVGKILQSIDDRMNKISSEDDSAALALINGIKKFTNYAHDINKKFLYITAILDKNFTIMKPKLTELVNQGLFKENIDKEYAEIDEKFNTNYDRLIAEIMQLNIDGKSHMPISFEQEIKRSFVRHLSDFIMYYTSNRIDARHNSFITLLQENILPAKCEAEVKQWYEAEIKKVEALFQEGVALLQSDTVDFVKIKIIQNKFSETPPKAPFEIDYKKVRDYEFNQFDVEACQKTYTDTIGPFLYKYRHKIVDDDCFTSDRDLYANIGIYENKINKTIHLPRKSDDLQIIHKNYEYFPKLGCHMKWISAKPAVTERFQNVMIFSVFHKYDHMKQAYTYNPTSNRYINSLTSSVLAMVQERPEYTIRIYTDPSIFSRHNKDAKLWQAMIDQFLQHKQVQIISVIFPLCYDSSTESHTGLFGAIYRFMALFDPSIDVGVVRDIDNIWTDADLYFIEQWEKSETDFCVYLDPKYTNRKDIRAAQNIDVFAIPRMFAGLWNFRNKYQQLDHRIWHKLLIGILEDNAKYLDAKYQGGEEYNDQFIYGFDETGPTSIIIPELMKLQKNFYMYKLSTTMILNINVTKIAPELAKRIGLRAENYTPFVCTLFSNLLFNVLAGKSKLYKAPDMPYLSALNITTLALDQRANEEINHTWYCADKIRLQKSTPTCVADIISNLLTNPDYEFNINEFDWKIRNAVELAKKATGAYKHSNIYGNVMTVGSGFDPDMTAMINIAIMIALVIILIIIVLYVVCIYLKPQNMCIFGCKMTAT